MDKQFNTIFREGRKLNMYKEIEDLQDEYKMDLQSTIKSFNSYDEISNETLNDLNAVKKALRIFARLGYLYQDEADDMIQVAEEQRLTVLEGLEGRA